MLFGGAGIQHKDLREQCKGPLSSESDIGWTLSIPHLFTLSPSDVIAHPHLFTTEFDSKRLGSGAQKINSHCLGRTLMGHKTSQRFAQFFLVEGSVIHEQTQTCSHYFFSAYDYSSRNHSLSNLEDTAFAGIKPKAKEKYHPKRSCPSNHSYLIALLKEPALSSRSIRPWRSSGSSSQAFNQLDRLPPHTSQSGMG
jgi:hypothetical protein